MTDTTDTIADTVSAYLADDLVRAARFNLENTPEGTDLAEVVPMVADLSTRELQLVATRLAYFVAGIQQGVQQAIQAAA